MKNILLGLGIVVMTMGVFYYWSGSGNIQNVNRQDTRSYNKGCRVAQFKMTDHNEYYLACINMNGSVTTVKADFYDGPSSSRRWMPLVGDFMLWEGSVPKSECKPCLEHSTAEIINTTDQEGFNVGMFMVLLENVGVPKNYN